MNDGNPLSLRATLASDVQDRAWRWVYRPLLFIQLGLYLRGMVLLAQDSAFRHVGGAADPALHENHIGNLSHLASQPNPVLLFIHLGMAVFWIGGLLVQKYYLGKMARAIGANTHNKTQTDGPSYRRFRRAHAILGSSMCAVALLGCTAGPIIAWQSHGHPAMRIFLLLLPIYFFPMIVQTWRSGRSKQYRAHQVWATLAFLGPAVASLWAEVMIYGLGRHTPLGSRTGELVAVALAWIATSFAIVFPTLRRWWKAHRAARGRGAATETNNIVPSKQALERFAHSDQPHSLWPTSQTGQEQRRAS